LPLLSNSVEAEKTPFFDLQDHLQAWGFLLNLECKMKSQNGLSLIELLVALVLAITSILAIAAVIPKASQSITANRQRIIASNLAAAKMAEIQKAPYGIIYPTVESASYFVTSGILHVGCDCNKDAQYIDSIPAGATLIGTQPVKDTVTQNSVVYTRSVCINQLNWNLLTSVWEANCPQTVPVWKETGLKNIRVRVSWQATTGPVFIDLDGVVAQS
jgi:Tfp pilus assembly protein PilV